MPYLLRLIILILLVWLGYRMLRKLIAPKPTAEKPQAYAAMVSCSHCGLHLPQSDAIVSQGRHYCSQEHALADQSKNDD